VLPKDRDLAVSFFRSRVGHFLTSARPSSFKWFLPDDGELAEFPLPTLDTMLAWAAAQQRQTVLSRGSAGASQASS
jgi:hypothetical protein